MSFDELPAVVIDNGSGTCQAGLAGEDAPVFVFPMVIGKPRQQSSLPIGRKGGDFVGDSALLRRKVLSLCYPIEKGIVTDWDAMETIWKHVLENDLKVKSEETNVLMTDSILNPSGNREKMCEVMMEAFGVAGFHVKNQGILSVYASGRNSATVLDIGDGVAQVFVIYEGRTVLSAARRLDLAGRDLTLYLQRLLYDKGYSFSTSAEMLIVKDMKERLCFVSPDYVRDAEKSQTSSEYDRTYTLTDGSQITLGSERFQCPEALFRPSLLGLEADGIHQQIHSCMMECGIDMRSTLYVNVVLSGGTTLFPGFAERLERELRALVPEHTRVRIVAPPERKFLSWIGGSILASLSTFQYQWITQEMYQEYGQA
uniref:Actin-3-like isoform X1 n=1 Tax=Crassostrea virginica TaxID=6565 RepID=A0A8B8EAR8_CRAVI|nr:actin-3-like isoform X1 [Crassostrea virginica]